MYKILIVLAAVLLGAGAYFLWYQVPEQTEVKVNQDAAATVPRNTSSNEIKAPQANIGSPKVAETQVNMSTLVLQPNEMPAGYTLDPEVVPNPGLLSDYIRMPILQNMLQISGEKVGRMYGAIYRAHSPPSQTIIVALEYASVSDLETDLATMTPREKQNALTFTIKGKYLIIVEGYSRTQVDQLTQQLRTKIN